MGGLKIKNGFTIIEMSVVLIIIGMAMLLSKVFLLPMAENGRTIKEKNAANAQMSRLVNEFKYNTVTPANNIVDNVTNISLTQRHSYATSGVCTYNPMQNNPTLTVRQCWNAICTSFTDTVGGVLIYSTSDNGNWNDATNTFTIPMAQDTAGKAGNVNVRQFRAPNVKFIPHADMLSIVGCPPLQLSPDIMPKLEDDTVYTKYMTLNANGEMATDEYYYCVETSATFRNALPATFWFTARQTNGANANVIKANNLLNSETGNCLVANRTTDAQPFSGTIWLNNTAGALSGSHDFTIYISRTPLMTDVVLEKTYTLVFP